MLYQGMIISVVGVSVVFFILVILVFCIKLTSFILGITKITSEKLKNTGHEIVDQTKISAIITAAIMKYKKGKKK